MHAKFQLIWTVRLVRVMEGGGGVEIDFSFCNWRQAVRIEKKRFRSRDTVLSDFESVCLMVALIFVKLKHFLI